MNRKMKKREKERKKTRKKVKKNNKLKQDKDTKGTSLIGWGGYGCIFQPSTNCDGSISKNKNNKYRTSKIQFYGIGGAKNEIFISTIIQTIPNFKKYFSPVISSCSTLPLSKLDPFVLNNCTSISEKKQDYDEIITTQSRYIKHKPIKLVLREEKTFPKAYTILLNYIYHLLEGITLLQTKDVIHFDIKDGNILYAYKEKIPRPVIIDFGISFLSSYVYESSDKYIQTKHNNIHHFNVITKKKDNKKISLSPQLQYTLFDKDPIQKDFIDIQHLKKRIYFFSPGYVQYPPEVHVIGYLLKYKEKDDVFTNVDIDILSNRIYNELFDELFHSFPYIQEMDYIADFLLYYKTFVKEKKTCYEVCDELYRHVYLWDVYSANIILFKLIRFISIHYSQDITRSNSIYYPLFTFCLRSLSPDPIKRASLGTFKDEIQNILSDL